MEQDNYKDVWNKLHLDYKMDKSNILKYDLWLDKYKDLIENCNTEIIDLGCGVSGNNTIYLIERGKDVISCDFAEEALNVITEKIPNAKIKQFDMQKGIPFGDESICVIIADLSLHYFRNEDTIQIINDIYRVLKNNGILLVRLNSTKTNEFIELVESKQKEIEHNLYFNKGMLKRFFSQDDIYKYFSRFEIVNMVEENMDRYKSNKKIVWNCCFRKL